MDYLTQNKILDADKQYNEFNDRISELHQRNRDLDMKITQTLFKINRLQLVKELAHRKSWEFESPSKTVDKTLDSCTGDDAESWFFMYNMGGDAVQEYQVELCMQITKLKMEMSSLKDTIEQACKDREKHRKEVIKKHEAKQSQ